MGTLRSGCVVALVVLLSAALGGPARAVDIDIAVVPPGCADPWQRVLVLAGTLGASIGRRGGSLGVDASAPVALADAARVVFPDGVDGSIPLAAIPETLRPDGDVEILETPFERIVVVQPLAGFDLLGEIEAAAARSGGRFPDVLRRRVARQRAPGAMALQVGDDPAGAAVVGGGLGATRREVATRLVVRHGDREGVVVAVSRSLGGPARVHRALTTQPAALVLHGGGVRDETCAATLASLGVVAAVPRTVDLARAASATTVSPEATVPFLAANLVDQDGRSVWPRHRLFAVHGVRVAVVGLVGSGEWLRAPEAVRARVRVTSGRDAVADVIAGLRRDPAGPPDLVVALSSGDGAERAQLSAVDGLDVVVADFARDDGLAVDIDVVARTPREQSRHDALLAPVLHRAGLGRIVATFDEDAPNVGRPRRLQRLRVTIDPLLDDGRVTAASATLAGPARRLEDEAALQGARVILPAVATIAALPAATPLVWGERIAVLGEQRRRMPAEAPLWTDDLWLRVVGNAVAADADVAVVRNMRRMPLVAGPLSRATAAGWLADTEGALVVDVGGAELLRLAERLAAAPPPLDDASGLLVAVGLDPSTRVVSGRPIEPLATYRIVVDERLLADPRLAGVIDPTRVQARPALATLALATFDGSAIDVGALVADRATVRAPEWRLGVPAFELRGSAVRTSPGLIALADSLETRALQRELVALSTKLQAFVLYDAPGFAWDNQLRVQYDVTFFADATRGPPLIEPFDDVVATSELRRELVRFPAVTAGPAALAAFVNLTADGEVTPVPERRRQAQTRQATGLVWQAAGIVREARLGVVAQQDLAEPLAGGAKIWSDAGALGLVRVAVPLGGPVMLDSTSDARFFFPDADDRVFDLALRAQSVTRVQAPLSAATNGFVFVDVVALSPKLAPARIEWNVVTGVGLAFGGVLRR
jgi:hypothetical protein